MSERVNADAGLPVGPRTSAPSTPGQTAAASIRRGLPLGASVAVALVVVVAQLASIDRYGVTVDSPALFYSGDRTLFWLRHPSVPGALDYTMKGEPAGFEAHFRRYPSHDDPLHYPVLPGLVAAVASAILHDGLGWLDRIAAHHVGLVLLNGLALVLFGLYACALLGRRAGLAALIALALYPSAFGHGVNNAKDWPAAQFYGIAILAAGVAVVRSRPRHLVAAAVFTGIGLSAKMNAAFVVPTLLLWTPIALRLLRRDLRSLDRRLVAAWLAAPLLAFLVFFVAWPWLWQGSPGDWWAHLREYVVFTARYARGKHPGFSDYPLRAVFFMTPPLVLAAAGIELLAWRSGGREGRAVRALLGLWLGLPILRVVLPNSNFYDANRHFIEYIPALAAAAGAGFARALEWIESGWTARGGTWVARRVTSGALSAGAIAALATPVVAYHPYQVVYFNSLIGGLGGAQQRALFWMPAPHDARASGTEGDYWNTSVRDALKDLRRRARPGDAVSVCGAPGPDGVTNNLVEKPEFRIQDWWGGEYHTSPFLLVIPRELGCWWREIREAETERPVLVRVERGGGLVYEILGKPDGRRHEPVSKPSRYETLLRPEDKIGHRWAAAVQAAQGRRVVKRVEPGGHIFYDVVDPATGEVVVRQQP